MRGFFLSRVETPSYGGGVAARQGYSTACLSRLDYWLGFWQLTRVSTAYFSQLVYSSAVSKVTIGWLAW